MGNQQAAFYYSLNYEDSNDSGFFDDEIFPNDFKFQIPSGELKTSESHDIIDNAIHFNSNKQLSKSKSIQITKHNPNHKTSLNQTKNCYSFTQGNIIKEYEDNYMPSNLDSSNHAINETFLSVRFFL